MAYVSPLGGEVLLIKIGDGGGPEVFTHPCLINTDRGVQDTATASVTELADCATPSNPAKTIRTIKSVDMKISGAGVMDALSFLAFKQWLRAGTAKNVKIVQNVVGSLGGWTDTVSMVITDLNLTGTRGDKQTCTLTLEQADIPTLAANAG